MVDRRSETSARAGTDWGCSALGVQQLAEVDGKELVGKGRGC